MESGNQSVNHRLYLSRNFLRWDNSKIFGCRIYTIWYYICRCCFSRRRTTGGWFQGENQKNNKKFLGETCVHFYNERYNFLIRFTWSGFELLSTIALSIALMKGMLVTLLIHIYLNHLCDWFVDTLNEYLTPHPG